MRIRWKTLIIIYSITLVLTLSFYYICENALLQRVSTDEKRIAEEDLIRLKMALSSETENLASKASDWSNWDDSYQFVEDNNTKFIETNLIPQAFSDLKVNLMIFVNNSDSIVFGRGYYLYNLNEMTVEESTVDSVINTFNQNTDGTQLEGFVKTREGTLLIVTRPILKSNYEGPAKGLLIFGIMLDEAKIGELSKVVGLPIMWCPTDENEMPPDFFKANSTLATGKSNFCTSVTETEIAGYTPIKDINSNFIATARITDSRQAYIETKTEIFYVGTAITLMGMVFLVVFYFSLDRFVLSRLSKLNDNVKRISENSDMKARTQTEGNDEISDLAKRIDFMLDQISASQDRLNDYAQTLEKKVAEKRKELEEANKKIIKTERMAAIGELAGMIAHDLRNPLTGIKNAVYLLKKRQGQVWRVSDRETLLAMDRAVDHSSKIINDLLDYGREINLDYEECSPKSLVISTLKGIIIPSQIKILEKVEETPKISVDTNKMQRVFTNLIKNSIDAIPNTGSIEIGSKHDSQNIEFSFSDNGVGMSKDVVQKLFTPLFTTKAQGMGFGLPICKRFVEAHGGKIEVESVLNKGTKFTIILPIKPQFKH
jgi:signal transduction histidine kinase